jgi:signal transduction histidine kinase
MNALPADLIAAQDGALFRRTAPEAFILAGEPAAWLNQVRAGPWLVPMTEPLVSLFPYLEVFLPRAEAFWAGEGLGQLTSDWWTQPGADGGELQLEAVALRLDGGAYLLVRRLGPAFNERRQLLQRAREWLLRREQLAKETNQKELLLHCIVHDLSAPLSSMLATLESVAQEDVGPGARRSIQQARLAARRQARLIHDLLDVFVAEVRSLDHFEVDPATAPDVATCVRQVVDTLAPALAAHGIAVQLQLPDFGQPCRVRGEASKLERILFNLLENARRHAPRGGTVTVEVRAEGAFYRVAVLDDGPGVPEAIRSRLFEKFIRAGAGGQTGLGLYFCRRVIEQWGGAIGYEPRPAGGSCFWFRLPRA